MNIVWFSVAGAGAILLVASVVAARHTYIPAWEMRVFRVFNGLPGWLFYVLWLRSRTGRDATANVAAGENPFELGQAIRFGLAFGAINFIAKAAQVYFGEAGLYLAGGLAGLTDVDAISLSMANLASGDPASASVAARTIVIAILSNTAVKGGMAMFMGSAELRRAMAPAVAATLAAGTAAALLLL